MLTAGARLGPYEIVSPLGAGGMGEVYLARDTRLDRTVAIKVLPAQFAADPESRARFDREARTISQLNHPHICVLYDVGHHEGLDFLVMEHLDGETLQARLVRGALACDDAIRIAIQIASALDRAHRAGIVHRDLKPGNIMLTRSGGARTGSSQAKLLDFGLAKAGAAAVTGGSATTLSATSPNLTARGTILGTFQYMPPEQLEGQPADARSDIFAFGAVLYEMLTGRKAFEGKSQASLIGAILKDQPAPISAAVPVAPAALNHVVARCLAKDPDARWQSAADLVAELQWIAAGESQVAPERGRAGIGRAERWVWIAAVAVALVVGASTMWLLSRPAATPAPLTARAILPLPAGQALTGGVNSTSGYSALAISPDGHSLVYSAANANSAPSLFIRAINEENPTPIPGTEDAVHPFFSPDGRSVGFQSRNLLKTVTLGGGAPKTMFEGGVDLRGADWGDDGWIYFAPMAGEGLKRMRADGGTPEVLTTLAPGEKTHRWPCVLPGGKAVLFVVGTSRDLSFDDTRIEVLSLDTRKRHPLITGGTYPRYLPSGHVVYSRAGAIVAVPFDLETLSRRGADVTVQSGVQSEPTFGFANFAAARDGMLVYVPGVGTPQSRTLLFSDHKGNVTPTGAPSDPYMDARASSDGARLVVGIDGATSQLAIVDLVQQGATARFTHEWDNQDAIWSPDHTRIAFSSSRLGGLNLYWQSVDSGGEATRLTTGAHLQHPLSWQANGKTLAYVDIDPAIRAATVWLVNVDDPRPRPSIKTQFTGPLALSPDGLWLAYFLNDSRSGQVYVQAFPEGGRARPISIHGGGSPLWNPKDWSPKGGELFYQTPDGDVMAVNIVTSPAFRSDTPRFLFKTSDRIVDVMPDGRFLLIKDDPRPAATHFNIVFNWLEELRSRAPVSGR